ncbi:hypothetical protein [Amycolatopsis pithecellobii]|uniref:Cupin domain-containing protein n=1 Tax=Amycolatopsis pithecellobii TaxID=664692 RepID=A0A6N7ZBY8_9PSEU|nr:hypothetical protein [Amycolatopsis pithecellobii]MTD59219.1 hypothetical protein [Amycolatopsis pithecellobii]
MSLTYPIDLANPAKQVVAGRSGLLVVETIAAGGRQQPVFTTSERVGYVMTGDVTFFVLGLDGILRSRYLPEGSYYRIPRTMIAWLRNESTTDAKVVVGVELVGGPGAPAPVVAAAWEAESSFARLPTHWVAASKYRVNAADEADAIGREPTGLTCVKGESESMTYGAAMLTVSLQTELVHGRAMSLMVATRTGAYHSTPHIHEAEQLNFVIRGSLNAYNVAADGGQYAISEVGRHEVFRIPEMDPHWAWSKNGDGSMLVEFHFPGLQGDPELAPGAVSLLADDPALEPTPYAARNIFIDGIPVDEVEAGRQLTLEPTP